MTIPKEVTLCSNMSCLLKKKCIRSVDHYQTEILKLLRNRKELPKTFSGGMLKGTCSYFLKSL